jgi:hypothetical protein
MEPDRNPSDYCETLAAWKGVYPERPEMPMWVRACAYQGAPVYFTSYGPWLETQEGLDSLRFREQPWMRIVQDVLDRVLSPLIVIVAVALMIRSLRLGRADRKGATRVALALISTLFISWLLSADYVLRPERVTPALAHSLLIGALAWTFYLALEPLVRRHWPSTLISWNRLLAGRWTDPLIGRDILIGLFLGSWIPVLNFVDRRIGEWMGVAPPRLTLGNYPTADHGEVSRFTGYALNTFMVDALLTLMGILLALAVLRALVRKRWLAVCIQSLVMFGLFTEELSQPTLVSVVLNGLMVALILFGLVRFGLLAGVGLAASAMLLTWVPLTSDLSAWYGRATVCTGVMLTGLATYGLLVSLPRARGQRQAVVR